MKLLLINPPRYHDVKANLPLWVNVARGNLPPVGLLYIAAIAEPYHQVDVIDMLAGDALDSYTDKPDVVGISVTTFTVTDALKVAREVKEKWAPKVIFGGIHPSIYPGETQMQADVDYVVTGEAELVILDMLKAIENGTCQPIVHGPVVDVTKLPQPARWKVDRDRYFSVLGKRKFVASMITSRGCPFKCVFCHRRTMGRVFRPHTAKQVVDEIKSIRAMWIDEVTIYDDTFTVDKKRVVDICKGLIAENVKMALDIRTRVDCVDEEVLTLLKEAGCARIHYGVEASSERILKILQKGITLEKVERVFAQTRKLGIETLAYFIIGSPGETVEDIEHTIKYAKKLNPDYALFSVMTPYPDTPLYDIGLEEKRYPDYWREFAQNPCNGFHGSWYGDIPDEELERLARKAYKQFYVRPSQILKEAKKVRSLDVAMRKGRAALGIIRR